MTVRQIIKILKKDGWYKESQHGSHIQFKHDNKLGKVTVPYHNGDIAPDTLKSILKQAGLL